MAQTTCSCELKEQIITEMRGIRMQFPGKENEWVDWLFPASVNPKDNSLCCLLVLLFYYGYCKECPITISEMARDVLSPLMGKQELN